MADENSGNSVVEETTPEEQDGKLKFELRARFDDDRYEIRAQGDDSAVMQGYLAPFNEWTEINSGFEGRFMERVAPGAFTKTLQERRPKVLYDHGHDPTVGEKPLGVPTLIEPRESGEWFEVELFDSTSYVRDLLPALQARELGVSFRFQAIKETFEHEPEPSEANPHGLPERTLREVTLPEFGPVTFPAYDGATVALRSKTVLTEDDFVVAERRLVVPVSSGNRTGEEPPPRGTQRQPRRRNWTLEGDPGGSSSTL